MMTSVPSIFEKPEARKSLQILILQEIEDSGFSFAEAAARCPQVVSTGVLQSEAYVSLGDDKQADLVFNALDEASLCIWFSSLSTGIALARPKL